MTSTPEEIWKSIPSHDGFYECSTLGRVRSVFHIESYLNRIRNGKVLRQQLNHRGYLTVRLCRDAKEHRYSVHGLVLLTFVGPKPHHKAHGCHYDGKKHNNALSNLRWGTPKDNKGDQIRHGTIARGERSGMARYRVDQVVAVRDLLANKIRCTEIARRLGVRVGFVSQVKWGRTWSWLPQ